MVRFFITPGAIENPASLIPGSATITVQNFAEKFLHLSQRTYWTLEMLQYASDHLETYIAQVKEQLEMWLQIV
jgi:hypothetical protein